MRLFLILCLSSCSLIHTKQNLFGGTLPLEDADKSYLFATKEPALVENAFRQALEQEGFKTSVGKKGELLAVQESKASLATFNRDFTSGNNYKVSEVIEVKVSFDPVKEGTQSELRIDRVEQFSMGQEAREELKDATLYRNLYSKVKIALSI